MGKRMIGLLVTAFVLSSVLFSLRAPAASAEGHVILEFDRMTGVPLAYTGAKSPIRGVNGGGIPWVIGEGKGKLRQSGELEIEVQGVVFDPNDPTAIARGIAGTNTVANFRAIVSCQSIDANGIASVVNVTTDLFPATLGAAKDGGGNAEIEAKLNLPKPCIAPIIFVTSPTGSWFAATGN
jgi:hypothetical protein